MVKKTGFKSVLSFTSTTGAVEIGQITDMNGPAGTATDVDTTTMDSSTDFRTFTRGPVDAGEYTFSLAYDEGLATHQQVGTLYSSGAAKTWTVYPGSSTGTAQAFSAYVSGMSQAMPLDGLLTADVTLKVSGDPAYQTT